MSEENALVLSNNLPVSKYQSDEQLAALTTTSSFLPRIQLFGSQSEMVQSGKIPMGHWGLVRNADSVEDLGDEVNCWPIRWRYKAMRLGDQIMAVYNPNNPEFAKIVSESNVPGQQGALAGLEFLLYLPDIDVFATYHMANTSARREAPNLKALIKDDHCIPATLKVTLAKNKKGQKWHAPVVVACKTPIDQPDLEANMKVIENFVNPKESEVQSATKDEAAAANRAR